MAHDITDHEIIATLAVAIPILRDRGRVYNALARLARVGGNGLAYTGYAAATAAITFGDLPWSRGVMPWNTDIGRAAYEAES